MTEVGKFPQQIQRLKRVHNAICDLLLSKGTPTIRTLARSADDADADPPDPIEKCLSEAEKLVREGKVMAAMEKENQCIKLIADSQP